MKVRFIAKKLTKKQIELYELKKSFFKDKRLGLKQSPDITVLGLSMHFNDERMGTCVWLRYALHGHYITEAPLCLFRIVDPRPSQHWEMRIFENAIYIQPPSFFTDYYRDDLAEHDENAFEDFKKVRLELEAEFAPPGMTLGKIQKMIDDADQQLQEAANSDSIKNPFANFHFERFEAFKILNRSESEGKAVSKITVFEKKAGKKLEEKDFAPPLHEQEGWRYFMNNCNLEARKYLEKWFERPRNGIIFKTEVLDEKAWREKYNIGKN